MFSVGNEGEDGLRHLARELRELEIVVKAVSKFEAFEESLC